ncbi:MAG: polyketide synthase dehydratase domain-containing protein, partial [Vicinamibacterales bacterium]|nr:polyketide synthase dehydratase domain-containing protein [Vicinamibacterales bacterium]
GLAHAVARLPGWSRPRLAAPAHGLVFGEAPVGGRTAFLFPGQGSEHVGMLRTIRARVPRARAWFEALDRAADDLGQPRPSLLVDPPDSDEARAAAQHALRDMAVGAQLGTVADLAMHEVARALGLRADIHAGHSNGEHAAVIAAGCVDLPRDALCRSFVTLGAAGAALPRPARDERLIAISLVDPEVRAAAIAASPGEVWLAMDNCPSQAIAGGAADAVDALGATLVGRGGVVRPLPFERAYHTPYFADWEQAFAGAYETWPLVPGRVPVWSCCTAAPLPGTPDAARAAMAAQWTRVVRFRETIERLHAGGVTLFIEVGPASTLTAFVEDTLRGRPHVAVAMHHASRDEFSQLAQMLAQVFVAGVDVDARALDRLTAPASGAAEAITTRLTGEDAAARHAAAGVHRRLIAAATAQLARAAAVLAPVMPVVTPGATGPLIAAPDVHTAGGARVRRRVTRAGDPFVDDHALGRPQAAHPAGGYPLPVLPFTASLEMAAEAARLFGLPRIAEVRDIVASRWLALDDGVLDVDIDVVPLDRARVRVRLTEAGARAPGEAFDAVVAADADAPPVVADDPGARPPRHWDARAFYARFAFHGPAFQGITDVHAVGATGLSATIRVTTLPGIETAALVCDPAVLDCAGQLVAFWRLEQGWPPTFGVFPFRARRVLVAQPPPPPGTILRARAAISEGQGATRATVRFEGPDGALVLAVEDLEQRIVPLTPAVARLIIAGDPAAVLGAEDEEVLEASWFIFERAVAHLRLAPGDLARWRALDTRGGARRRWLLARLQAAPDVPE